MNKVTVAVIIIITALFGGLVVSSFLQKQADTIDYSQYDSTKVIAADENNGNIADHVRGKADSSVVLVEYADMQCPGCASVMPRISELTKLYGDRVAFIFRSFPIQGHKNARAASAAIESASQQGYFWDMVEIMYSNRAGWINLDGSSRTDEFARLFKTVAPDGDEEKFRSDLSDENIEKKINFDYALGANNDKITGTPAFLINGKAIDMTEVKTMDDIRNFVEDGIKNALKEAGLPSEPNYDSIVEVTE